ncbi:MAG: cupin domain-containing protein [Acidimicrobiales bacterium]
MTNIAMVAHARGVPVVEREQSCASRSASALSVATVEAPDGRAYAVVDQVLDRSWQRQTHVHQHDDEVFYVLDGQVTVDMADQSFPTPAGFFLYCPRGVEHSFSADFYLARLAVVVPLAGFQHPVAPSPDPEVRWTFPSLSRPELEDIVRVAARYL